MANPSIHSNPAFIAALQAHEQQERIDTGKVAAALVVFLMPAGVILDFFSPHAYPRLGYFFALRLLCSLLTAFIWWLFTTSVGSRYYRILGLPIAWLPAAFISWMIYDTDGPVSPYYAGLNLILLAVSAVVHWNVIESVLAVFGVILMYAFACYGRLGQESVGIFVNNLYFITLTGIIVVVGNLVFNRLRLREFASRYELDQNRVKLEETNQKLIELDQVKSRFFANISHELRTPLTLLLAPLERLRHQFKRSLDDETSELLTTMQANGMRLLKLINDLLDLVRLESGRMEVKRESVEVAQFVHGLASATRHMAEDKRIRLETWTAPELGSVSADRDKLEKVLLNLLFNALKFTPAGGRVELRAAREQADLVLTVSDTGMGIAEKSLPYIFDRFWQADTSSKRKYQGAGIGLALAKELVELQGGKLAVESQEGKGATFTVRVPFLETSLAVAEPNAPVAPEEVRSSHASSIDTQTEEWLVNLYRRAEHFPAITSVQDTMRPIETWTDSKRPRVLVADDEPDMLRFLKSQLSEHYQVLEAVDGQQAIEKAAQFLPDLILLDMMMPEKDGLQACRELRERTPTQSIPIILLTARADDDTKLAALEAGASDFLPKPFSTTELHVRIKNLVESFQYQRHLTRQNLVLERTIEQLKETEMQLVQTEKMASLGRLSAGIIHEINNPLNYATMGLFTLRSKGKLLAQEAQAEYADILNDVEEGIKRVKDIVGELRMFSYADNTLVEEVDLAEVLGSALRFISHQVKEKVEVQQRIPKGMSVRANKNKLVQVIMNLLQNSLDALGQKPSDSDRPAILIEGRTEGGSNLLVIRDNGRGIAPEHLDKVFDPFFTTKEVGEGLGLGLSICYRIMQEFGGRIRVRSEPGQFCEVIVEWPAREPATAVVNN
jgi:signal transduction histidine kinase